MDNGIRKPYVFIVYQGFETELASSLQVLLQGWGYEVFQCRQRDRDGKAYREELRENIRKSDLVIFLLSREFRWSPYCQAEAGTAMALEKPYVPVLISPAEWEELGYIAPVLEGFQGLRDSDPDFISELRTRITKLLPRQKESTARLIANLQFLQQADLLEPTILDLETENKNREEVRAAIMKIQDDYQFSQPKQTLSRAWPTLGDPECRASIVTNIVKLLTGDEKKIVLTFIGVSLKFSLHMITDALKELEGSRKTITIPAKTLQINLVHMHEHSHILHALKDERDIESIRESFGKGWPLTTGLWRASCGEEIKFLEPAVYRIDYIPPRVGILLEAGKRSLLYAGRCAFNQTEPHLPVFTLDVGENEYLFYSKNAKTKGDDPNYKAIKEFHSSFNAYKAMRNNTGITPIWESNSWIYELRQYIESLKESSGTDGRSVINEPPEITFISGTATVFEPLILKALEMGATVRTYVSDPANSLKPASDLFNRLSRERGGVAKKVRQYRYQHPATFRGVVIRDRLIAYQTYVIAGKNKTGARLEVAKKLPLCLIITPCFAHFNQLQEEMLSFADTDPLAAEIINLELSRPERKT